MDIQDLIVYSRTVPRRKPSYVTFPEGLSEELKDYLKGRGIDRLYSHQAEMFERALKGENIVITTSTASGKTLAFLLPVLQEILKNPLARAIFIYPTKALAADQYRALLPYIEYFGENRISAGVYDGDTPVSERSRIRKTANIILTNPEMVNGSFLPNHSKYGFDFIFSNLKYVVIDELHTYRGAFGSHLANVFRRFSRVCRYYHSTPQYLLSSATIANPLELASGICGRKFSEVSRDGSGSSEKKFVFLQPPKIMGKDRRYYGQMQTSTVAAELLPELVENHTSFLAFAKSRKNVEVIVKEAKDKLEAESFFGGSLTDKISGYRGGYTATERKEIENKMITGELCGLVSTNALELGIDIGQIESTVIVGYPGTRASFWQQTGRAGRNQNSCLNYLILDQLPFDQYIAVNPSWLFEEGSESAVIDKNNLLIELAHIRAAAAEIPLTLDDIALFPDLGETIPVLMKAKELTSQEGCFAWTGGPFPAGDFSLRNIDKVRYKLLLKDNGREITEMDEMQAFRELHKGAVYMHGGMQYLVTEMDQETRTSYAVTFEGNYYTMPGGNTEIRIIADTKNQEFGRVQVFFGDVNVEDIVYMFKKLQFHNHQNLGFEPLEQPLAKDFDTEAAWIGMPEEVVNLYRRLLIESENGQYVRNNHFEGLCYALENAAMMLTMTEREDIGAVMSQNATGRNGMMGEEVFLFLYDKYIGGLGYAEKAYDLIPKVINQAIELVQGCGCENGCAACIGDYRLDKNMVLWGLKSLLEELNPPENVKTAEYGPSTYIKKEFRFKELPDRWQEFGQFLLKNGEKYAAFLSSISSVEIAGGTLRLYTEQPFYVNWVMEEANRKSLVNMIRFYTDAPAGVGIEVKVKEIREDSKEIQKKLQKRYQDLGNE